MRKKALQIVKKLRDAGYESYWAGGCVRDILMDREPNDFDIVTSAKPDEIKQLLKNTIGVGKKFGVMIAKVGKHNFEIATFRSEGKYSDARRPDRVFWSGAEKDAKRRDFTINSMFYDPVNKKVIDHINGQDDIKKRIIKFVGNPNDRIKEDYLRLLRAIRFKNSLSFKYDKRTWEAICSNAYRIEKVSKERVADELGKMFLDSHRAQALDDLSESGILKYILPEIEKLKGVSQPNIFHKEGDVFVHTLEAIKSLPKKAALTLIWAVLLHDSGKPDTISYPAFKGDRIRFNKHAKYSAGIASKVCRRLKFSNIERHLIVWLVKNHMKIADIPKMKINKKRRFLMDPRFKWLLKLFKADIRGTKPHDFKLYEKNLMLYDDIQDEYKKEKKRPKFKPILTGADIIYHFKLDPGPQIGKILKMVEDAQLSEKIKTKKEALDFVRKNLRKNRSF